MAEGEYNAKVKLLQHLLILVFRDIFIIPGFETEAYGMRYLAFALPARPQDGVYAPSAILNGFETGARTAVGGSRSLESQRLLSQLTKSDVILSNLVQEAFIGRFRYAELQSLELLFKCA